MVGTKLKTVFFATVLAAILVIVITLCIILIPSRPCIQIDSIEHLQMVQTDDALQVTWVQPLGHGDCAMTYRIQLSNGTHLIWSGETVLPVFNFFNLSFTPCLPYTITVYAVSYLLFGNVTGSLNTFVHFGNIGPVTNLQALQENDALLASWDPPIDSEYCSLSYEVTLQTHQVSNVTFDTAFTFEQVESRPCVANTIIVVPLGEINEEESLRGQQEIHAHFGEVGSVEDLQVELEGTTLLVSWSPPIDTEECQLAYQVTLSYEDVIQEYVTQVNYHNFNVPGLTPCSVSNISVTPVATVGYEEVRGLEVNLIHIDGLGPVVSLELTQQDNSLFASWEAPHNSEYCGTITYEVVLQTSDGMIQESHVIDGNQLVFEQANLEPCTINVVSITALAIMDDEITIRGYTYSYTYFADIGQVENLAVVQAEGNLMVNWMRPAVTLDCPLTYEITLWHDEGVAETTTTDSLEHTFEDVDVRPCVMNEVSVIPIASKDLRESKGPETRSRHFGEIGSVTNFELVTLDQDNQLVARWDPPIESDLCELSYELLLETSEGEPPQVFSASQLEYVFNEVDPRPCVAYTVTITPVAILEGGPKRGLQATLAHVEDIGPVEELEINQSGESLLVTWVRPVRSELCQMSYEVALSFGEDVLDRVQTYVEGHTFVQANLQPCTENHVSVIPTGHNQELATQGPELSERHFAAVGPVQNLIFQEVPFGISWTEPTDSGACVLSYQVQIDSGGSSFVTGNFYPLEDIPCHHYTATVTPLVQEDQSGPPLTETHNVPPATDLGPVRYLSIFENAFVWEPPINAGVCVVWYQLEVTINGESTPFVTTDRIHDGLPPCSMARIEITAAVEGHVSAAAAFEDNVPLLSLGAVQNLEFLNDRVQWVEPSNSGVCPIEYRLTHTSGSETVEERLSETYFLIDLEICSHHVVSVYAFYERENEDDIVGILESAEISLPNDATPIGQVQSLIVSQAGLVEWLPPVDVNINTCEVTYSIILNRTFDVLTYELNVNYFQIPDVPCSYNELSLHAVVNGYSGEEDTITYEVGIVSLGAVQNLEFLDDRVQWVEPSNSGVCPIEYGLTHTSGSETVEERLSETYFLIDLEICSHHVVSVYAFYERENGDDFIGLTEYAEISLPNVATSIGQVQGLTVTEAGLALWLPPGDINIDTCEVTYSIILNRTFDVRTYELNVNYFQIPDVPCSYNELSLHAVVNGYSGEEATTTHEVDSVIQVNEAPVIVDHSTTYNSVTTVWEATPMEINACQITAFSVWIGPAGSDSSLPPSFVTDNKDRVFILETGGLASDKDYQIRAAVHILNFPSSGPSSDLLFFRTDPAPPEIDEPGDFMKLTWESPTDPFVSGYEVTVHDNGPAHFLPSNCVQYNPQESVHVLNGNTTEFLLTSYLPSHNYTISVTPLGASENYVTPEARPGAPSLSHEFLAGDDVTAVVSWPIPCDVNGKLVKFSVEMQGFEEDVFAEDGRENYSVEIERLSKGSVYTVYVQTHLRAHRSDKSAITFKTPEGL